MTIVVVIPWRDTGDPHRKKSFEFVRKTFGRILPEGLFLTSDSDTDKSFNRGQARNWGVSTAMLEHMADVVVLADADTIPEEGPLREAIYNCQQDGRMHLPYTLYRCLTSSATKKALRGQPMTALKSEMDTEWAGSGTVVITPKSYWDAGGQLELDGWGAEDSIFKICADAILGRTVRHEGIVHHLWHPILWRTTDETYIHNMTLAREFDSIEGDPVAIKEKLDFLEGAK